ncbi:2-ketoacid reductase [Mesorhizobium plurifarium]|uniref:2-ketoacid reductase n=1 Tax=Mesorhizobium plurifarium TaxID=69974 RepID=A0A090D9B5_MESPL|nr:2-ketoacid reductase [Mesorhizobium plurifarium]
MTLSMSAKAAKPCVLFLWEQGNALEWKTFMERFAGDIDFRVFPDVGDRAEVDYIMTWMPPLGEIEKYPNVKAIFSIGAGVSHILRDPNVPRDIPIVRLTDDALSLDMSLYALHWTLHFHRGFDHYLRQKQPKVWKRHPYPANEDRKVGVLGLGEIGGKVAELLRDVHFDVGGWSRSKKNIQGVSCFVGEEGLAQLLRQSEILISVLPPTPETSGLLNEARLRLMPKGAFLINMGRGDAVVDDDLVKVLDEGHLAGAVLDVFREEPLPSLSPYWSHPSVVVTPHAAAPTNVKYGAKRIAENIMKMESGRPPHPLYNASLGY